MSHYHQQALLELEKWQAAMQRNPSLTNRLTRSLQQRINHLVPEKVHQVLTAAIKQMVRAVVFGASLTTSNSKNFNNLHQLETKVRRKIKIYRSTAALEGGVTGAGGFLLGLADFPLWLSIKMKMMYEIAALYGMDLKDYKERVYILHIFQLTFSSQQHRKHVYDILADWENQKALLPQDINLFDWRTFQLEYRDYIDLAKFFQLIPLIGAAVGAAVNHRLTNKLATNAMNAYRMRILRGQSESTAS
jgi:uncharacterized protein (DUF697 family)